MIGLLILDLGESLSNLVEFLSIARRLLREEFLEAVRFGVTLR